MTSIIVKYGEFRGKPVINREFVMLKGIQEGVHGSFITVLNDNKFPVDCNKVRIKVDSTSHYEIIDGEVDDTSTTAKAGKKPIIVTETDEEAMDRISNRFQILDDMAAACIRGDVKAMIVSGPPGVGKSFGVEQQLEKSALFDQISGSKIRHNVVKGAMTALGLYAQLYKYSEKKNVLVFDDCDSVFADELSLNILKAALDSGKRRRICWNSDSRLLRDEGIPNSFDFKGSAIFITNLKFENVRSKKLQDHLEALESRCHFVDLTIDSERDKMLRIRQVNRDAEQGLFGDYNFTNNEGQEVLDFMEANNHKLRELSIRTALKIADLIKISPNSWKMLAESTVMRRR
jgi:hypothetical protein